MRFLPWLMLIVATWAHGGLVLLPGSSPQTVKSGQALLPIRVQLTDDRGVAVKGAAISTSFANGAFLSAFPPCIPNGGSCSPITDESGIATAPPLVGNQPGHWQITIGTASAPSVAAEVTVTPLDSAAAVAVLAGDGQTLSQGMNGMPFLVRVTRDGNPVQGETVRFTVGTGGGPALFINGQPSATAVTNASGEATSAVWRSTAGIGSGTVTVQTANDNSGREASAQITYYIANAKGETYYPYKPMWWGGALQSGWGLAVPQHGEHVFPVYFSYDSANRPTWKLLQGAWSGGVGEALIGNLYAYTGAPYFAFDTTKVHVISSLPAVLAFRSDTSSAMLTLNANNGLITPPPPSVSFPVQPFSFAPAVPRAELGVSDIWWGGPTQSGWGIDIAEDHGNLFLTWFTYDADGRAVWFVMPEGQWVEPNGWAGPVFKTTGSSQVGGGYDPTFYRATQVGMFAVKFTGTNSATFSFNVEGHAGFLNLQRFDY